MKNHVYKILEIVGSSETSFEEAISTAVAHASAMVSSVVAEDSSSCLQADS